MPECCRQRTKDEPASHSNPDQTSSDTRRICRGIGLGISIRRRGRRRKTTARLILVYDRLPVTLRFPGPDSRSSRAPAAWPSVCPQPKRRRTHPWVGWPGDVPPRFRRGVWKILAADDGGYPVFLPPKLLRLYRRHFANHTLRPLFHSFPRYARYASYEWSAYREANEAFADRVAKVASPRDTIWVHDHHLLLLPEMLREQSANARIGFFLHIPILSYNVFRLLRGSRDVLRGLLGADLVGFHTCDYSQSFLRGVRPSLTRTTS